MPWGDLNVTMVEALAWPYAYGPVMVDGRWWSKVRIGELARSSLDLSEATFDFYCYLRLREAIEGGLRKSELHERVESCEQLRAMRRAIDDGRAAR